MNRPRNEDDRIQVIAPYHLRKRVLQALGNKCVTCGTTRKLQIDHVYNDGKAHRKALGTKSVERWLCEEYDRLGVWPSGFQLLCDSCHRQKTLMDKRKPTMPPRKGYVQCNVSLSESVGEQLNAMAIFQDFKGSKSAVVEAALEAFFQGRVDKTLVDNLHNHLSTMQMSLQRSYTDIPSALDKIHSALHDLQTRLDQFEHIQKQQYSEALKDQDRRYEQLLDAFDRLTRRRTSGNQGWLARLFFAR